MFRKRKGTRGRDGSFKGRYPDLPWTSFRGFSIAESYWIFKNDYAMCSQLITQNWVTSRKQEFNETGFYDDIECVEAKREATGWLLVMKYTAVKCLQLNITSLEYA